MRFLRPAQFAIQGRGGDTFPALSDGSGSLAAPSL